MQSTVCVIAIPCSITYDHHKLYQERSSFGNSLELYDAARRPSIPVRISKELIELGVINNIWLKDDSISIYQVYDDSVDLRIFVMTFNQSQSLQKTLHSLQDFITDCRRFSLEIWIDKPNIYFHIDSETLRVVMNFRCTNSPANVWIRPRHVEMIGQWLYTRRTKLTKGDYYREMGFVRFELLLQMVRSYTEEVQNPK